MYTEPSNIPEKYIAAFWAQVERKSDEECWEWRGPKVVRGYGYFNLKYGDKFTRIRANRLAWMLTNGAIADGMLVCHKCDNRLCCNPSHLFLGTPEDNSKDMVVKRRGNIGERNPQAKLTEVDIYKIAEMKRKGMNHTQIAMQFGVVRTAITAIVNGRRWGHIWKKAFYTPKAVQP